MKGTNHLCELTARVCVFASQGTRLALITAAYRGLPFPSTPSHTLPHRSFMSTPSDRFLSARFPPINLISLSFHTLLSPRHLSLSFDVLLLPFAINHFSLKLIALLSSMLLTPASSQCRLLILTEKRDDNVNTTYILTTEPFSEN